MMSTSSDLPGSFTDPAAAPAATTTTTAKRAATASTPSVDSLTARPLLDHPVGHLSITLISARNLPKMDLLSDTDAFAKLSVDLPIAHAEQLHQARAEAKRAAERAGLTDTGALGAEVHFARTATVTDSRTPVWHEQFDFAIHSIGGPVKVYLEVADEDSVTSHDLIGRGEVDLRSLFAATESGAGPLNAATLPSPPSSAPGVPNGFKEDDQEDVTGHYVSVAEAGLTGGIRAARSVWVPLVGDQGQSTGEILLLVYYEPKTRLDRAKARVSQKVTEVKDKLTATVVGWITDWTAGQVKASFK